MLLVLQIWSKSGLDSSLRLPALLPALNVCERRSMFQAHAPIQLLLQQGVP
jgi:hypothetical protein